MSATLSNASRHSAKPPVKPSLLYRLAKATYWLVTGGIWLGCVVMGSTFTPLFSHGILFILNHVNLPANATPPATPHATPTAIVVLGGGLTSNAQNDIVVNDFTLSRLQTAKLLYDNRHLPIIVSGKEAPWMQRWLQSHGVTDVIMEKNSNNTCENARFTAQTADLTQAILVTDKYHMNRARRQFALNDIATVAEPAALSVPTSWQKPYQNLKHSRRALYELVAFARDVYYPQENCRERP